MAAVSIGAAKAGHTHSAASANHIRILVSFRYVGARNFSSLRGRRIPACGNHMFSQC
jgi:hypothetical protein